MHLGMPVVALAATEAAVAVPPEAGTVTTRREVLTAAVARFLADPGLAAEAGRAARRHALERYGLKRFLDDWDQVLGSCLAGR
jgi:glycosyltransferase involved in cell wall biosynthesis